MHALQASRKRQEFGWPKVFFWFNIIYLSPGGGGGIRTRDTVSRIHTFQACAFDRSATPPACILMGKTKATRLALCAARAQAICAKLVLAAALATEIGERNRRAVPPLLDEHPWKARPVKAIVRRRPEGYLD
jgi:hypothetical protein